MDEYGFSAGAMGAVLASPALSLALLAALVVWAAASDLKSYTIPNAVCGLTAALAIVFHLQAGGPIGAALLVGAVTAAISFASPAPATRS
jgi:Flp pilus assembly protein protease CpaA